jgi:hypothetical protein
MPAFSSALTGSSIWGSVFSSVRSGSSTWISKKRADFYGTGGLYTRPSGIVVASPYVRPAPRCQVKLGGAVVRCRSGRIRLARNEPIDWSITIDYAAGNYGPLSDVAVATRLKSATWSFNFVVGDELYQITNLVAEEYAIGEGGEITISGTDLSHKLNVASFMGDVDCIESRQVMEEIDAEYGVTVVPQFSTHLDYYHRLGKPIEWVRELSGPLADWGMEGANLVVSPVEYGKSTRWAFTEKQHLEVLTYKASPWAIRNRATVVKEVPAAGLLLEVERNASSVYEEGFFGAQGPFTFPYPARFITARVVRAERGKLTTFSFRGNTDNGLSGVEAIGGYYGGYTPAVSVRFNYEPGSAAAFDGSELWTPGYKVRFFAISADRVQCGAGGSGNWTGNVSVGGQVTPYDTPFVMSHFTDTVGQQLANAYAYEGALKAESVSWQTQLAPWVKKGFTVALTERRYTGYSSKAVFIQALEHSFDHTKDEDGTIADSGTTTYEGSALLTI